MSAEASPAEYIRPCPGCGTANPAQAMRCACGVMLLGVDLVRTSREASPTPPPAASAPRPPASVEGNDRQAAAELSKSLARRCVHDDCAQPNPSGALRCVYCDRPLPAEDDPTAGTPEPAAADMSRSNSAGPPGGASVLSLPSALRSDYRILRQLPTRGAEADLLLVEPVAGGHALVAKLYRHGVAPKSGLQERLALVDPRYWLPELRQGQSDGRAFALMDYCAEGSLRDAMRHGPVAASTLTLWAAQLSAALHAVHNARIVHRDIKPENILVRQRDPLQLVLIDFGIASVLDATQRFTGMARTLAYAAPESLSGVIDTKADYWGLGMILLEASVGAHPFAGLSDAVIVHHLATRGIDTLAVADRSLRTLIKGLLLRDPAARWGHAEFLRWSAGDTSLPEPQGTAGASEFTEGYLVGDERCRTPEQLAQALARHWGDGVADLFNGQLLAWFRDVQRDQNTVRLIIDTNTQPPMNADVRLLRLLLHMAPNMPPVWCSHSVSPAALLNDARSALRGNEARAQWLAQVHEMEVLQHYARAGNAECAAFLRRWDGGLDAFEAAWEIASAAWQKSVRDDQVASKRVALWDDLVYGNSGPRRPTPEWLHPRLLLALNDPAWCDPLRARLALDRVEAMADGIALPWPESAPAGSIRQATAAEDMAQLLVQDALLPQWRASAPSTTGSLSIAAASPPSAASGQSHRVDDLGTTARGSSSGRGNSAGTKTHTSPSPAEAQAFLGDTVEVLAVLASGHRSRALNRADCIALREDLQRYHELLAKGQASGATDAATLEARKLLRRAEPAALRLLDALDDLQERLTAVAGLIDTRSLGIFGGAALVVGFLLPARALAVFIPTLLVAVLWVTWPIGRKQGQVRRLLAAIDAARIQAPRAANAAVDPQRTNGERARR